MRLSEQFLRQVKRNRIVTVIAWLILENESEIFFVFEGFGLKTEHFAQIILFIEFCLINSVTAHFTY